MHGVNMKINKFEIYAYLQSRVTTTLLCRLHLSAVKRLCSLRFKVLIVVDIHIGCVMCDAV
jgi:hypothetical protein